MLTRLRTALARSYVFIPLAVVLLALLIWAGYQGKWTGFAQQNLWEWLKLLVVPAVLGVGALLFNRAGQKADLRRALDEKYQTTLTTYFDRMSDLLLTQDLRSAREDSEVRSVARARTVSALRNLDGARIARLIQFLTESGLGGTKLVHIELPNADLSGADFRRCDLTGAILARADLSFADLREANLSSANLREARLSEASLGGANLDKAYLSWADLSSADLRQTSFRKASLSWADMKMARLDKADLSGAMLMKVDLRKANLREVTLTGAVLREADLTGANVSLAQLAEARALTGATMPDGSRYEVWTAKSKPDWTHGAVGQ